jgi:hypothetical protein
MPSYRLSNAVESSGLPATLERLLRQCDSSRVTINSDVMEIVDWWLNGFTLALPASCKERIRVAVITRRGFHHCRPVIMTDVTACREEVFVMSQKNEVLSHLARAGCFFETAGPVPPLAPTR